MSIEAVSSVQDLEAFYSILNREQRSMLERFLLMRNDKYSGKRRISVVFDLLHMCNIKCYGCGADAQHINKSHLHSIYPTFSQIERTFSKIYDYAAQCDVPAFVNIGGGEPFLRDDILDILTMASEYFGADGVGVDTNATLPQSRELLSMAMPYVSYVGISINGLCDYHNWWTGCPELNPFASAMRVISQLCESPEMQAKLEITTVATRGNMAELPELMSLLSSLGVRNYSIHRAIPVGRMAVISDIIPDAQEYLQLLVRMIEQSERIKMRFHLHHSIENIHSSLLLGCNTYCQDQVGDPNSASSIGIDPEGLMVYDPWCTTGPWRMLNFGNVFSDDKPIATLLADESSLTRRTRLRTAVRQRCNSCLHACSGGNRIVAAATMLNGQARDEPTTIDDILDAFAARDPACPLYWIDRNNPDRNG